MRWISWKVWCPKNDCLDKHDTQETAKTYVAQSAHRAVIMWAEDFDKNKQPENKLTEGETYEVFAVSDEHVEPIKITLEPEDPPREYNVFKF